MRPFAPNQSSRFRLATALMTALLAAMTSSPVGTQTLPKGASIPIRLNQTISSYGSKAGSAVRGTVIAPVEASGGIVIPLGAEIAGTVHDVRRVGLGFSRESAWVHIVFDSLRLPGGAEIPITGRVTQVDNARETIDDKGRIRGIRATASFSSVLSGTVIAVSSLDPMLLLFGLSASLSTFRIPESEVLLPAGTELHFEITEPVTLTTQFPPAVPGMIRTADDREKLAAIIRNLPFRTATAADNHPSDLTNLVFLGTEQAVRAAFDAAGWAETDVLSARSTYGTLRSVIENQGYREAPMSTLL